MYYFIVSLFLLSGCMSSYQPPVTDTSKHAYEKDRQECLNYAKKWQEEANDRYISSGRFLFGAFGLSGAAVEAATSNPKDDFHKSPTEIVDKCMVKRGYKLKN